MSIQIKKRKTMKKTLREAQMERIVNLLKNYAEEHLTHPDPVARLYSAFQELRIETQKEMNLMREKK